MPEFMIASPTSPKYVGVEQRCHPRVPLKVSVGVCSDSNFYVGMSNDISEGGLFIATHQARSVGSEISVELFMPGGNEVRGSAIVRWVCEPRDSQDPSATPGMGVQFVNLDPHGREAISEFIENRDPLFFD